MIGLYLRIFVCFLIFFGMFFSICYIGDEIIDKHVATLEWEWSPLHFTNLGVHLILMVLIWVWPVSYYHKNKE
jgi:hypothetical protein